MKSKTSNRDQYLKLLGLTWYVLVGVPRTLEKLVGNTHVRRSGTPTPVKPTFLRPTDFKRRILALETGVLGHGRAAQAGDFSTSCRQVFLGGFHSVSLRLSTGNWCHLARSVQALVWVYTRQKQEAEFIASSAKQCQNVQKCSAGHRPQEARRNVNSTAARALGRKQLLGRSAPVQSF